MALGYQKFFVWVLISSIPAIILSRFIPIGRRAVQAHAEEQPAHA
jgi:PAT family beta-lactamase induction signal transducer AmpG